MTDEVQNTPAEQTSSSSTAGQTDWKARYDGLVRKVEQLTLENRTLTEQLAAKTSNAEQLQAQLGLKDTEKSAAISARDQQLQEAVQAKTGLENELKELRAYKLKVEVAKELKRPDLIKILDRLPGMEDREALKTVLTDFASFADDAVKERETQLLSGVTPGVGSLPAATPSLPASEAAWYKHIESLPLGSPERQKAQDQMWDWLNANNRPK
jgi:hypothetical protein